GLGASCRRLARPRLTRAGGAGHQRRDAPLPHHRRGAGRRRHPGGDRRAGPRRRGRAQRAGRQRRAYATTGDPADTAVCGLGMKEFGGPRRAPQAPRSATAVSALLPFRHYFGRVSAVGPVSGASATFISTVFFSRRRTKSTFTLLPTSASDDILCRWW